MDRPFCSIYKSESCNKGGHDEESTLFYPHLQAIILRVFCEHRVRTGSSSSRDAHVRACPLRPVPAKNNKEPPFFLIGYKEVGHQGLPTETATNSKSGRHVHPRNRIYNEEN
ncbi:hypothetical protein DL89DRAFT_263963 [Linderina pennispora]|uniref:Uncharacterized protein n=1 Tax=Linderina pennispora TaxID=61395 RepID=A0A1Y1WKY3_9FUNG|nr:uncharacterized protein DL89DRAFT_263963 [Linderina pennispora]ORX73958.1 hypothetical protein DL89DRAFT_263963 [Linderina pennispora]